MDNVEIQRVIDALTQKQAELPPDSNDTTFDAMTRVLAALRAHTPGHDLPYVEQLAAWGVLSNGSEAPQPALDRAAARQINELIKQRINQARLAGEESQADTLRELRVSLLEWSQYQVGPFDGLAQLRDFGLWPVPVETSTQPAQHAPEPVVETVPDAAAEAAAETMSEPEHPGQKAEPIGPMVQLPLQPVNSRYTDAVRTAQRYADEGQYDKAVKLLEILRESEELDPDALANLSGWRTQRQQALNRLIVKAEQVAAKHPRDLQQQEHAWEEAAKVHPDNERVQQELARIPLLRRAETTRRELARISQKTAEMRQALDQYIQYRAAHEGDESQTSLPPVVAQAFKGLNGSELESYRDELAGYIGEWAEEDALPGLVEELRAAYSAVEALRPEVAEVFGQGTTIARMGNARGAFVQARQHREARHEQIINNGFLPDYEQDAWIPVAEFYKEARSQFLAFLTGKIDDRMGKAREAMLHRPPLARQYLTEIEEWLADPLLGAEEKGEQVLAERIYTFKDLLAEVNELLTRYEEAGRRQASARNAGLSARERLDLLDQARALFSEYPGLDEGYTAAWAALSDEAAQRVERVLTEVSLALSERANDDDSLRRLQTSRDEALASIPEPAGGSRLDGALKEALRLRDQIVAAKEGYATMQQLVGQAGQMFAAFEDNRDTQLLRDARSLLDQVAEADRRYFEYQGALARLATLQGDEANWDAAQEAYQSQKWADAARYFREVHAGPNSGEAKKRAGRATAARLYEEAQTAEREQRWAAALDGYKTASDLWAENGTDVITSGPAERCAQAAERLRPMQESEQRLSTILNDLEGKISSQQRAIGARQNLITRLESVVDLKLAVDELIAISQRPAFYPERITRLLDHARNLWRSAYLDTSGGQSASAIEEALQSQSSEILRLANERVAEMEAAGLLYEAKHARLSRTLRQKHLDLEYQALQSGMAPRPADAQPVWQERAVEDNRRSFLKLLETVLPEDDNDRQKLAQERAAVQKQYLEAHRERIEAELRGKPALEAATHLDRLFAENLAQSDPDLLARLIELYWQAGQAGHAEAWDKVSGVLRSYAPRLPHAATFSVLWSDLTRIAQLYANDKISAGEELFQDLLDRARPEETAQIERIQKQLRQDTFNRLLEQAEKAKANEQEQSLLLAAEKYSLASELFPENTLVRQGLRDLGPRIQTAIATLCHDARGLTLGRRDLASVISQARKLESGLTAVQQVAGLLQLSEEDEAQVEVALAALSERKARWEHVARALQTATANFQAALQQPLPINPVDNSGGWDFSTAENELRSAAANASGDNELAQLVVRQRTLLTEYKQEAGRQVDTIAPLMEAIRSEVFEQVAGLADAVEAVWHELDSRARDFPWGGREAILRYSYGYRLGDKCTPRDHRAVAAKQLENYKRLKTWQDEIKTAYETVTRAQTRLLGFSLADLVRRQSLRSIVRECSEAISACGTFLEKAGSPPEEAVYSRRAQSILDGSNAEERCESVLQAQKDLGERKAEANERLAAFEAPAGELAMLRRVVQGMKEQQRKNRPIPQATWNAYEVSKSRCAEKDPLNESYLRLLQEVEKAGL